MTIKERLELTKQELENLVASYNSQNQAIQSAQAKLRELEFTIIGKQAVITELVAILEQEAATESNKIQ